MTANCHRLRTTRSELPELESSLDIYGENVNEEVNNVNLC